MAEGVIDVWADPFEPRELALRPARTAHLLGIEIDRGELLVLDTPRALKRSIGEGDVLEIALLGDETSHGEALAALAGLSDRATISATDGVLHVRAPNVVDLLPQIVDDLRAVGITFGELRLRENTLEDVFIHLTGRRLRP